MAKLIQDIRACLASFFASYLTLLLPLSLLLTLLMAGASLTEGAVSATPLLAFAGLLYATVPAFCATRGLSATRARLKAWVLAAGDAMLVGAVVYFIPFPAPTTSIGILLISFGFGAIFLALCLLTMRALRLAGDIDRASLRDDFKLIWKISPGLLIRMFLGLLVPTVLSAGVIWFQKLGILTDPSIQMTFGLLTSLLVLVPASFMPFLLLAEGLKRAGITEPAQEAETTPEE